MFKNFVRVVLALTILVSGLISFSTQSVLAEGISHEIKYNVIDQNSIGTMSTNDPLVKFTLQSPEITEIGYEIDIQSWFHSQPEWVYFHTDFTYTIPDGISTGGIDNPNCSLGFGCVYTGYAEGTAGGGGYWTDKFYGTRGGYFQINLSWKSYDNTKSLVDSGSATINVKVNLPIPYVHYAMPNVGVAGRISCIYGYNFLPQLPPGTPENQLSIQFDIHDGGTVKVTKDQILANVGTWSDTQICLILPVDLAYKQVSSIIIEVVDRNSGIFPAVPYEILGQVYIPQIFKN